MWDSRPTTPFLNDDDDDDRAPFGGGSKTSCVSLSRGFQAPKRPLAAGAGNGDDPPSTWVL
jgi:hypothetical protein